MPNPKLSIGLALIETSLLKLPAHKAGLPGKEISF
jgi:hypothetical protein